MRRLLLILLLSCSALLAQNDSGELRLKVTDAKGLGLHSSVELTSTANQYRNVTATDEAGQLAFHHLPNGTYSLRLLCAGFAPVVRSVEIRSSVPQVITVVLKIATASTILTVTAQDTLLDPTRTSNAQHIGSETIATEATSLPGRSVQNLVNAQPGWLYEGSAVLHPRGSEYQVQYVVDGIPMTENRSPGFGPQLETGDVQSMSVYTGGFPAEYGRKLGGVIEVNTARGPDRGWHGSFDLAAGSFDTENGRAEVQYGWGANTISISGGGGATDWYLNPPVPANYNNRGTLGDLSLRYDHDFSNQDRLSIAVRRDQARFQVPDELVQQSAGQRQDRGNDETLGTMSFQHVFTPNLLGDLHLMARSVDALLSSNPYSVPIVAAQNRSFTEQYVKGSLSYHHGPNDWKAGVEADFANAEESFADRITDPSQFDPGTPAQFRFYGSSPDREQAAFLEDTVRLGAWTANLGLRWDHYQFLVDQNAVSPRIGIARYFQQLGLVVHGSYDRVFQTPAMENLLLSSSSQVATLNPQVLRLPVKPSTGNYFEAGASKEIAGTVRADLNGFYREVNNFADDDLLLNTSVSFPIAFRKGRVYGTEAKLELPTWKRFSGWMSYSYLVGTAYLPVTGGLFLGSDATNALSQLAGRFPITQDQRNTVRARGLYQLTSRVWAAVGAEYGSGLPTEFDGSYADAVAQYGQAIVDRVNIVRGRLRPNFSVDLSAAAELWKHEKRSLRLQGYIENLNNRLNLIDFAGLFSGTSLLPPRSYHLRLSLTF